MAYLEAELHRLRLLVPEPVGLARARKGRPLERLHVQGGRTIDGKFDNYYGYVGWHYDIFRADNVKIWAGLSIAYEHFETGLNGQAEITNPDGTITRGAVLNDSASVCPRR